MLAGSVRRSRGFNPLLHANRRSRNGVQARILGFPRMASRLIEQHRLTFSDTAHLQINVRPITVALIQQIQRLYQFVIRIFERFKMNLSALQQRLKLVNAAFSQVHPQRGFVIRGNQRETDIFNRAFNRVESLAGQTRCRGLRHRHQDQHQTQRGNCCIAQRQPGPPRSAVRFAHYSRSQRHRLHALKQPRFDAAHCGIGQRHSRTLRHALSRTNQWIGVGVTHRSRMRRDRTIQAAVQII